MAGSITAALFLSRFVENTASWMHCDVYAWNIKSRAAALSVAKRRVCARSITIWKKPMADPSEPRIKPDPRVNPWRDDLAAEHLRGEIDAPVYARGHDRAVIAPVTALRRAPAHGAMMDTQLLLGEKFRVYEERGPWVWGQAQSDDYVGYVLAEDLGLILQPRIASRLCAVSSTPIRILNRARLWLCPWARMCGSRGRRRFCGTGRRILYFCRPY